FARSGKSLTHVTPAGEKILALAEQILQKTVAIKRVAQEFQDQTKGELSLATTHTQARYALPKVIHGFTERFPDVSLHMHQCTPMQMSEKDATGEADVAIAKEAVETFTNLVI